MKINKKTTQNAADLVSLEYELFFKYLRVSPSFQLAHAIRKGEKSKSSAKGVMHLSQVMKIYDIVGDVFNTNFPAWWETKGHLLFSGKEFVNLSIKLDLIKDKKIELARIKNIIDNQYEKYLWQDPFLHLQKNKIRFQTLEDRMHLLEAKACDFIYDSPKSPGWRLLDIAEVINTKHSLRYRVKNTSLNTYERSYLTMLSSRHLNEALLLAENAALGKFPCLDKNPSSLKFDLRRVSELEGIEARMNYFPYTFKQHQESPTLKRLALLRLEMSEKREIKEKVKKVRAPIVRFYRDYKSNLKFK
jgi:hypothetical protein